MLTISLLNSGAPSKTQALTTSVSRIALDPWPATSGGILVLDNQSADDAFVCFGQDASVTVTMATALRIPAATMMSVRVGGLVQYVAAQVQTGTGTLRVTQGAA